MSGWHTGGNRVQIPGGSGPQGPQGATGAQGAQGSTGAQGPQGTTGATGAQGPQGFQGTTGAQGPQGFQGPQGDSGAGAGFGTQTLTTIEPPDLPGGRTDDYNPAGWQTANIVRLGSLGAASLSGLAAPSGAGAVHVKLIVFPTTANSVSFLDEHLSSAAANRIIVKEPVQLIGHDSVWVVYDSVNLRWVVVAR